MQSAEILDFVPCNPLILQGFSQGNPGFPGIWGFLKALIRAMDLAMMLAHTLEDRTLVSRKSLDEAIAAMFSNPKYNEYLFYAHLVGQCSVKLDPKLPAPAGVRYVHDHYDLLINPESFAEFSLEGRLAVLKHEMLHIVQSHVSRAEDRRHEQWNIAADCAINQFINLDHLPEGAIIPSVLEKHLGTKVPSLQSAEYYYEMLRSEGSDDSDDSEGSDGTEGIGTPLDTHETWNESTGDDDLRKDVTKKMLENANESTIRSCGSVPAEFNNWIALVSRPAVVDWRRVLRGIVGNKRCNKRPTLHRRDRRFPNRPELRGKVKDRTFDLLVVVDVSGSMSNEGLVSTLSELKNLCKMTGTTAKMIQVDVRAHEPEELSVKTTGFTRKGQGGTFISAALEKAEERSVPYQGVVVVTDGELLTQDVRAFEELNKRVIWLIHNDRVDAENFSRGRMRGFQLS